nr:hypothetical protein [Providencia stuartii]ELR5081376.1 hypothetical protein [Providencia stuartii]
MNTSEKAGWLTPNSDPVYDEELERQLSRWVQSISGLDKGMVRPRWQPKQPAQPAADINWCGFGITDIPVDDSPAFVSKSHESTELQRHEEVVCTASFYGPHSQHHITQFRDGMTLTQNNDELGEFGLSVVSYSRITPFPELINNQWVRRYDITVTLRRKVVREYGIKTIVDAPVKFFGE